MGCIREPSRPRPSIFQGFTKAVLIEEDAVVLGNSRILKVEDSFYVIPDFVLVTPLGP
jgi:hypothetical protein